MTTDTEEVQTETEGKDPIELLVDLGMRLNEAEREHYQEILRLNREVKEKQYKYELAKAEAKCCKEDLDCASMELSTLIADGPRKPDPQQELPFGETASTDFKDWDLVPITEALKLTAKQREKLEEIGIRTIGQFEFLRAGNDPVYPDGLRSIKGFGSATIDAMENDIVNWLTQHARETPSDDSAE
jgi:hypothetical protein